MKNNFKGITTGIISTVIIILGIISALFFPEIYEDQSDSINNSVVENQNFDLSSIPAYSDSPYVILNNNIPNFTEEDKTLDVFEFYSPLDNLGRVQTAFAMLGQELMPTEKRGDISSVKPTGWQSVKYDFVDGGSLYNRCHLIAFQLAGENANKENLMTGTRYLNVQGMLPFENQVANYIKETGNHVLYRVTPIFEGDNLVANGVQMEALSVEDNGAGVSFNVYCYNIQPGVTIDYATGNNEVELLLPEPTETSDLSTYVINTNSSKFHDPDCSAVDKISENNKEIKTASYEEMLVNYNPCGICNPEK